MSNVKKDQLRENINSSLVKPVGILSTGIYIPEQTITNDYWVERVETSDKWIREKTGIKERRFTTDENTSDMCVNAARDALKKASLLPQDIDILIVGTFTPDYLLPSTALIVKTKLNAVNAIPIDLSQTACAGLIYGIHLGTHLLQNSSYKNILVVCGESFSKIINPMDRTSSVFVGDAAGSVILRRLHDKGSGILSWDIGSKLSDAVGISHGGTVNPLTEKDLKNNKHKFYMKGKEVWNEAVYALPKTLNKSLKSINCSLEDLDFLLCHQANKRLVEYVLTSMNFNLSKTHLNVERLGNTGSATLPTVLDEAITQKKIKDGDLVGLIGIGVGFLWGSIIFRNVTNYSKFE
ncbi:ketoacyl-ACP synthase III [Bacillaceae bacterium Marseille-Q3522]|nr:ketoacyl-ACP synthase III [Bacillaceae bacterium Marseille-Q3522]